MDYASRQESGYSETDTWYFKMYVSSVLSLYLIQSAQKYSSITMPVPHAFTGENIKPYFVSLYAFWTGLRKDVKE